MQARLWLAAIAAIVTLPLSLDADAARHRSLLPGHTVKILPARHSVVKVRGTSYFFVDGHFYRRKGPDYVVISAPVGAVVRTLPAGFVTVRVGSRRLFSVGGAYYHQISKGYEVVQEPAETEEIVSEGSDRLVIYPAAGQTDAQRDRDRFECHDWAAGETGYDPSNPDADPVLRPDYQRAMTACLVSRDYVVN